MLWPPLMGRLFVGLHCEPGGPVRQDLTEMGVNHDRI